MKILLLSFEFPPQAGGIGTYSYQMANHFHRAGHQVTVLAITHYFKWDEIVHFDQEQKFEIIRFKKQKLYILDVLHRIFKSIHSIYRHKFDIIFITHYAAAIIGFLAKIVFHIPFVLVGHGTEYLLHNIVRFKITKYFHQYCELLIVNSDYTCHLVRKRNIKVAKIEVIPLGADDEVFNENMITLPFLKSELTLSDKFVLLTVGSLSARKDHSTVFKALSLLINKYSNLHYLVIGTGPLKLKLETEVRQLGLEKHVSFLGHKTTKELPNYYNCCDLFILNSTIDEVGDTEGFGIVLIEANLMKKAVIGTKNSGMVEAIEDGKSGILIEMNNPGATADAIEKIYNNDTYRIELGKYGYERAIRYFTWNKTASRTIQCLENILQNGVRS